MWDDFKIGPTFGLAADPVGNEYGGYDLHIAHLPGHVNACAAGQCRAASGDLVASHARPGVTYECPAGLPGSDVCVSYLGGQKATDHQFAVEDYEVFTLFDTDPPPPPKNVSITFDLDYDTADLGDLDASLRDELAKYGVADAATVITRGTA